MKPDCHKTNLARKPAVTIVVVPRERFSCTRVSLESLYANTNVPFHLIYVDGGSPANIGGYLKSKAEEKGFRLIRTEHYLSPNQARNIGLRLADTEYVVFVDNDVEVAPGWLTELVQCAEEENASLVGPLYCIGPPIHQVIHMAGGEASIREEQGRRRLYEKHRLCDKRVDDVQAQMHRGACELIEFHCMLARREIFEVVGPLDEELLNTREHVDLCLAVRKAGRTVWFEPKAIVTQHAPNSIQPEAVVWADIPFYLLRWSDAWGRASLCRFEHKWDLDASPEELANGWLQPHRQAALRDFRERTCGLFGESIGNRVVDALEQFLTTWASRKGRGLAN